MNIQFICIFTVYSPSTYFSLKLYATEIYSDAVVYHLSIFLEPVIKVLRFNPSAPLSPCSSPPILSSPLFFAPCSLYYRGSSFPLCAPSSRIPSAYCRGSSPYGPLASHSLCPPLSVLLWVTPPPCSLVSYGPGSTGIAALISRDKQIRGLVLSDTF